ESVDPNNPNSRVLYRIGTGRSDEPLGTVTTVTNPTYNPADIISDRMVGYTSIAGPYGGSTDQIGDFNYAGRFLSIYDATGTFDENGDGYFDSDELWVSGNRLYAVNSLTGLATARSNLVIQDGNSIHGIAVAEDIKGLAFEGSLESGVKGNLYAIWDDLQYRDGNGNPIDDSSDHESIDRLITINEWTGEVQVVGTVSIADNPDPAAADSGDAPAVRINTSIRGMDFDANGELIAIHGEPSDAGVEFSNINGTTGSIERQTIMVHLTNPTDNSIIIGDPGSIRDDLYGYASDSNGRFYSIFDFDYVDQTVTSNSTQNSELWASEDFNPLVSVNGDFNSLAFDMYGNLVSANIDIEDITFVTANVNGKEVLYAVIYNKDQQQTELYRVNRNPVTGGLNFDPDMQSVTDTVGLGSLTFLGVITDDLGMQYTGIEAITSAYDTNDLYVVGFNADVPVPDISIGADLGVTTDIYGITTLGDRTFILAPYTVTTDTGSTTTTALFEVIYADDGSVSSYELRNANTGLSSAVNDLAANPGSVNKLGNGNFGGTMYAVDSVSNSIYEITIGLAGNAETYNVTTVGSVGIYQYSESGTLNPIVPVALSDTVKAMAVDRSGKYLYIVLDSVPDAYNPGLGDPTTGDYLIQVRIDELGAAGTTTAIAGMLKGEIVDQSGNDVDVVGMDFTLDGDLVAIDTYASGNQGAADWRMILIDTTEAISESLTKQVDATQISLPGSVDTALQGYAINRDGRGLSVRVGATPSEIYITGNQLLRVPLVNTDVNQDGLTLESVVDVVGNLDVQGSIYSNITGMISHPNQPLLFASANQEGSNITNLLTLSTSDGSAGVLGAVQVDGDNTSLLGLALHADGTLGAIDAGQGDGNYRTITIGIPTVSEIVGVIRVDSQDTQVSGIDFIDIDGDGVNELVAFDDSQRVNGEIIRRFIEINTSNPSLSTELVGLGRASTDISGLSAVINPDTGDFELYSFANDAPLNSAIVFADSSSTVTNINGELATVFSNVQGDLGDQYEFVDITVTTDQVTGIEYVYAVIGNNVDGYQLGRFEQSNPTAVTIMGDILSPSDQDLDDIYALTTNPNSGDIVFVGRRSGQTDVEVFTIEADNLSAGEAKATRSKTLHVDGDTSYLAAGAITALAFLAGSNSNRLFGIYAEDINDVHTDKLVSISLVSGNV
ncbi:MAG TPA: hypothetical protein DCM28_18540, partial [Phycisphaerales bacterium]|nr:hypothetical protein [Phycisphaerales bacterium]